MSDTSDTPRIDAARLSDHLDRELMFRFFAAFSRFEYALKASTFMKPDKAEPDWSRFGDTIAVCFSRLRESDPQLSASIDELLAAPPRKQTPTGWKAVPPQGDERGAKNVVTIVCRVRNNLFHGGKAQRQGPDGDRDNRLVRNSLVVLDRALMCEEHVHKAFIEV